MHTLNRTSSNLPLVICEGAFDALSYEQENYPILATMGGAFSKSNREQLPVVISAAKQFPYVLLSFDTDESGRKFTLKLGKFVDTWGGIVNEICKWIAVRVIFRHVLECRWDSSYLERYAV